MSIVPLSFLNPHWLSGRSPDFSRCSFNRFSRTLARIFPATDNKEMPRLLSQTWGFPFLLKRWIIVASLNNLGIASFLHIMWNNSVKFQGGPSAVVYYFCHCMSLHVCPGDFFLFWIAVWPVVWERNCPFGFLLEVFWLWCLCFKCVIFSLCCLRRGVLDNCIDSWSLPSFLFVKCNAAHTLKNYLLEWTKESYNSQRRSHYQRCS